MKSQCPRQISGFGERGKPFPPRPSSIQIWVTELSFYNEGDISAANSERTVTASWGKHFRFGQPGVSSPPLDLLDFLQNSPHRSRDTIEHSSCIADQQ
jgi:hypothetical protein